MKKAVLVVLLILALSVCASADDELFKGLKGVFYGLYIADTGVTFGLLQNEAYVESNPLWRPFIYKHGLVLAMDFGILIGTNYLLDKLHGWKKWLAYVAVTGLIVVWADTVHHNWKLAY